MIKKLYIDTEENRINRNIHSENYEMYTLYNAFWDYYEELIPNIKKIINEKLKPNSKSNVIHSTLVDIIILNNEDLILYDAREDEDNVEKTYFYIKQEALWQAIRDYNNIDSLKKYKRITISYDGNKVYFDLEPFETNKENV